MTVTNLRLPHDFQAAKREGRLSIVSVLRGLVPIARVTAH